jgi:hypothetical protein
MKDAVENFFEKSENLSACILGPSGACPFESKDCFLNRAGHPTEAYLRAAQAYMLISMPTDTSTIFGAFQAI